VLLDFEHELGLGVPTGLGLVAIALLDVELDLERVVDLGQVIGREGHLDHHALHLLHRAGVGVAALALVLLLLGLSCGFHVPPYRRSIEVLQPRRPLP
jgi:hypothetical protein